MSNQKPSKDTQVDTLLTPKERAACQNIATGKSLYSQRAKALLALDGGATQAQAGQQTGLTRSQVKYWLSKFRADRLEAFPEGVLAEAKAPPKPPEVEAPVEAAPASEDAEEDQPEKKAKQDKKSEGTKKKAKKAKKKKKGKDKKKKKAKKKKKSKKKNKK